MAKQICKEHWPTIEFEIVRSVPNQPLGINFMEVFFINRPEVTIQNITPNSLASQVPNLKGNNNKLKTKKSNIIITLYTFEKCSISCIH